MTSVVLFGNNEELSLELRLINILSDNAKRVNNTSYTSYRSKRVVRSISGAKTYSFADCFEPVYFLLQVLCRIAQCRILIAALTDSPCLFNVIIGLSTVSEPRPIINFKTAQDANKKRDIDDVGWVKTTEHLADTANKNCINDCLKRFMGTSRRRNVCSLQIFCQYC